jgi:hypothetical protein
MGGYDASTEETWPNASAWFLAVNSLLVEKSHGKNRGTK